MCSSLPSQTETLRTGSAAPDPLQDFHLSLTSHPHSVELVKPQRSTLHKESKNMANRKQVGFFFFFHVLMNCASLIQGFCRVYEGEFKSF